MKNLFDYENLVSEFDKWFLANFSDLKDKTNLQSIDIVFRKWRELKYKQLDLAFNKIKAMLDNHE
jgi:hypothetical protein